MPVDVPIVATAVLVLLHAPPVVASARVVVADWQTDAVPVIALTVGVVLTVATFVAVQPPDVE